MNVALLVARVSIVLNTLVTGWTLFAPFNVGLLTTEWERQDTCILMGMGPLQWPAAVLGLGGVLAALMSLLPADAPGGRPAEGVFARSRTTALLATSAALAVVLSQGLLWYRFGLLPNATKC